MSFFSLFHHVSNEEAKPEAEVDPLSIGSILLKNGVITQEHLDSAAAEQDVKRSKGRSILIGELLVARGACSEEALEEALRHQRRAHLPDSSRPHAAMDKLDRVLKKSERRTEEMKTATTTAMMAFKGEIG